MLTAGAGGGAAISIHVQPRWIPCSLTLLLSPLPHPFLLHLLPLSCKASSTLHSANRHLGPSAAALKALQLGSGTRARLTQSQNLASAATRPEGMEMRNSWSPPLRLAPQPALLRAHHLGCSSACRQANTLLLSKNPPPLQSRLSFLHPTSSLGL